ncbi:hypothetical protein LWI29_031859 [Acer saccharum]|uniref:Uncharacterized protein n=1 Tax=Acer saccharum TaxID=4024 RepID=A0AA39S9N6_ACESA|nr:hypothetical protein LWI29_031859 [Acer saccharum]
MSAFESIHSTIHLVSDFVLKAITKVKDRFVLTLKPRLITEKWKVPVNFWEPEFQVDPEFNGLRDLI